MAFRAAIDIRFQNRTGIILLMVTTLLAGRAAAQFVTLTTSSPATPQNTPPGTQAGTQPTTHPAEWEQFDAQRRSMHMLRHMRASLFSDDSLLDRAEAMVVQLRSLCLEGHGREAVQGDLPGNQTGAPAVSDPSLAPFTTFNANHLERTMEIAESLKTLEDDFGNDDYEYLECVYWLSMAYRQCGDYGDLETAERWATEACNTFERMLKGKANPRYAVCLDELACDKIGLFKYEEAEALLDRAMAVVDDSSGPDNILCARIANDQGTLELAMANYPAAIVAYRHALGLVDAQPAGQLDEFDHVMRAMVLQNLGMLAEVQGDNEHARQRLRQALAEHDLLTAKIGDRDAMKRAECLESAGSLSLFNSDATAAQLDEAETDLTQARKIYEKELGFDNPQTARLWMLLAELYQMRGDARRGDANNGMQLFRDAMKVYERTKDQNNADRISRLIGLVGMCVGVGDDNQALVHAQEALDATRAVYGASTPPMAEMLEYFGQIQEQMGRLDDAKKGLHDALSIMYGTMDLSFAAQTEDEQLRMTRMYRTYLDGWLSFYLRHPQSDAQLWGQVISWKGTVFARQQSIREARRIATPQVLSLFNELEDDTRQIQGLTYANSADPSPNADRDARITKLRARADELEENLSRQSASFAKQRELAHGTPADIQRLLPPGAALVDFLRYSDTHSPPGGKGLWINDSRYVAFVVTAQSVTAVPIGPAEAIDDSIERWRTNEAFPIAEGLKLRGMVWDKLEPAMAGARLVLISPDGPLASLPFAALPADPQGSSYLIERYAIATIPVPQLLPMVLAPRPEPTGAKAAALLVGAVNFDAGGDTPQAPAIAHRSRFVSPLAPRGSTNGHWDPLPGAAEEIAHVIDIFHKAAPNVPTEPLEGAQASKAGFIAGIKGKEYLHVATHAFFAAGGIHSVVAPTDLSPTRQSMSTEQTAAGMDPGLLSGLVFAGANHPVRYDAEGKPLSDDGILTALEVSRMDLSSLRVVALSACETALGKAAGGEGVFGLQRAFQLAGARTVLASLWKVDDRKTSELMSDFYQSLLAQHQSPIIALRRAQLQTLAGANGSGGARRGFVPGSPISTSSPSTKISPALWAAWVLSGDPGDLRETLEWLKHENDSPPLAVAGQMPASLIGTRTLWAAVAVLALSSMAAGGLFTLRRHRRG